MKYYRLLALAAALTLLPACDSKTENALEDAGEAVEEAAEDAGDAVKDAVD